MSRPSARPSETIGRGWLDDRAVAPAVGKTLEIGIGVVVLALLATTLYGSVIPGYRTAAGAELGDRALARAVETTESALPPEGVSVTASRTASLPTTIRGATYGIEAKSMRLELRHPHPRIGGSASPAVPARVLDIRGSWRSTDPFRVTVAGNHSGVTMTIGGDT